MTQHGPGTLNSDPFLLQPADQPEQLTVTHIGVAAQVDLSEITQIVTDPFFYGGDVVVAEI